MARRKLSQIVPEIRKAVDKGFAEFLAVTQGQLMDANPADTGRMASSWYIGHNSPNRTTRPEDWAPPGAKKREAPEYTGKISFAGDWYVSNSVPYAERVALDPRWAKGGAGGAAWFRAITTQLPRRMDTYIQKYLP